MKPIMKSIREGGGRVTASCGEEMTEKERAFKEWRRLEETPLSTKQTANKYSSK